MRVLLIAESFWPSVNGVATSVARVAEELRRRGDDPMIIAPQPDGEPGRPPTTFEGLPLSWLPSLALPRYPSFRVAAVGVGVLRALIDRARPDVVHLASPFVLGWDAVRAAGQLGVPSVAVYQTDVPAYAGRYGWPALEPLLWRRIRDIHARAGRTLAPSESSVRALTDRGVPRVHRWGRGVDAELFQPRRRDPAWHARTGDGDLLVGFVGRLAAEKQVEDLAALAGVSGVRLVIIGDGPQRDAVARALPTAVFTGWQSGTDLARAVASLDVVVHPGESDTFGQTVQEAMACGVPVVAVRKGGPGELVHHGTTGLHYDPGDLDELRRLIIGLRDDTDRRQALGRSGRAAVCNRSWRGLTESLTGHYRAVADIDRAVAA